MNRRLKMGMIGGGSDAFIGAIHRCAALMDNRIELVCGCFSINPEISYASGKSYFLPDNRIYRSLEEMIEKEKALPEGERMDFLTIVTPNMAHFKAAVMALENGFDVVIEKPMTFSLQEAYDLKKVLEKSGRTLALTHTYTGYPAVKDAKKRVANGDFGKIRKVVVEYMQGWLSSREELNPISNAGWRTDPKRSGKAGCIGDIGTHALNLAEYITGLKCISMCADLTTFVPERALDDDGAALLRFEGGAKGVLMASQIAAGEENNLTIRVYGEKGGLEWHQMEPNSLILKWITKPIEIIRTGSNTFMGDFAKTNTRTPGGHPEGYIEAFANIYHNFTSTVMAKRDGVEPKPEWLDFPTVDDGIRGMQFIETSVHSGYDDKVKWFDWVR
jgi:predicted dehydrogenase